MNKFILAIIVSFSALGMGAANLVGAQTVAPPVFISMNAITPAGIVFLQGATQFPPTPGSSFGPTIVATPVFSIPRTNNGVGTQPPLPPEMAAALSEIAVQMQAGLTPAQAVAAVAEPFAAQLSARSNIPFVGSQLVPFLAGAVGNLQGINTINGSIAPGTPAWQNPAAMAPIDAIAQTFLNTPIVNPPVVLQNPQDEATNLQQMLALALANPNPGNPFVTPPPVVVTPPPVVTPPVTPPTVTPTVNSVPISIGNFTTTAANAPGNTTPVTTTGITFQTGSTAYPPFGGFPLPTLVPIPTLLSSCRTVACAAVVTERDLANSELAAQLNNGLTPLQAVAAIAENFATEMSDRNNVPFLGSQLVPPLDTVAKGLLAPIAVNGVITPGSHTYQDPTFLANANTKAQTFLARPITGQLVLTTDNEAAALQATLGNQAIVDGVTPPAITNPPVVVIPVQPVVTQPPVTQLPVASTTVPAVTLPVAPTPAQIQNLAVNALVAAAQAGGTLTQMQNAAAQTLLAQLNAPNATNPNGGTVTLAQALVIVTSNPAAGQAAFAQVAPQTQVLLAQNAAAAALAPTVTPPAVSTSTPATPIVASTTVPTIVTLPNAPTPAQIQNLAVNALVAAAQAGGSLTQMQNAAAQTLLSQLNAPNIANPNGGTVTFAQAFTIVTSNPAAGQATFAQVSQQAQALLAQNMVATVLQIIATQTPGARMRNSGQGNGGQNNSGQNNGNINGGQANGSNQGNSLTNGQGNNSGQTNNGGNTGGAGGNTNSGGSANANSGGSNTNSGGGNTNSGGSGNTNSGGGGNTNSGGSGNTNSGGSNTNSGGGNTNSGGSGNTNSGGGANTNSGGSGNTDGGGNGGGGKGK